MSTKRRPSREFSVPDYLAQLSALFGQLDVAALENAISVIREAGEAGRKVLVCGNGGSALTASHYVHEWNKMVFLSTRRPFRSLCLSDNVGLVTAYANDLSFADVFAEQLKNQLDPGDLVIAVSGSGNSENVVRAVQWANENGGVTLAVCGYDGGRLKSLAQHLLHVPSFDMQLCEDVHFMFGHMVMKALCGDGIAE